MHSILWPAGYLPGFSDNFCSNEVIVRDLTMADAWPLLATPRLWPGYYANSANPRLHDTADDTLTLGQRFYFETFGFPVEAEVVECVPPSSGEPARLAWHGWAGSMAEDRLDVHHAWLLEELPGGRLRILTQETQNGAPAIALAQARPNPMINGHQDWLDGLVTAARRARQR